MSSYLLPVFFDRVPQISSSLLKSAAQIFLMLSLLSATAMAQTPQTQPSPQAAPPSSSETAQPEKPPENSGLFGEIGKLLSAPAALLPSLMPADSAATPAPAPAPVPVPAPPPVAEENPPARSRFLPGIVSGRELCPRSDNGAPDCKTGSDRLCRSKGYSGGNSLSTDAIFACSAKPLQTRGKPCATENYVTRAFCQ